MLLLPAEREQPAAAPALGRPRPADRHGCAFAIASVVNPREILHTYISVPDDDLILSAVAVRVVASLTGETTCGICHRNHWILACDKFLTCFVSIFFRLYWNKGSHLVRKNTAKRDPSSYLHHDASRNEQMISESWVIQRCRSLEELRRKQLRF